MIAVLAVLTAALALTGCSLKEVKSLTILDPPVTTYVMGSTPELNFTVLATMNDDSTRELTYSKYGSVLKLSGFSTAKQGIFTATVTYRNVSATFEYVVVQTNNYFPDGSGTAEDPYIINTEEQFKKTGNIQSKYFKLNADLTFSDADAQADWTDGSAIVGNFYSTLDGNGHKITLNNGKTKPLTLFGANGTSEGTTVKNLNIYSTGIVSVTIKTTTLANITAGIRNRVTFSNVNRYGNMALSTENNLGPFMIAMNSGTILTMENCENHVDIKGTAAYVGGFLGIPVANNYKGDDGSESALSSITMTNCVNYGDISGQRAGAFFANAYAVTASNITMTDCRNEGQIFGAEEAGFYFATGENDDTMGCITDSNKEANINAGVTVPEKPAGLTVTTAEDGTVTVTKDTSIAYVVVRAYFWADLVDSGTLLQIKDESLNFTNNSAQAKIKKAAVQPVEAESLEDPAEWIVNENGESSFKGGTVDSYTCQLKSAKDLRIFVMAFDANGELIGGVAA